jgi:integrase
VKLMKVPKQPFTFLMKDQAERLLSHTRSAAPNVFPLYALAVFRGMRMGELYGLRWCDVDLDRKVIVVRRNYERDFPKDKEPRWVPLDNHLARILKQWCAVCPSKEFVFPFENGEARLYPKPPRGFEAHLKAAGCPRVRFHDLRHTAASLMVMAGASLQSVQAILGHSTIAMTERYAHHSAEHVANEAAKLSFKIQKGLGQLVAMDGGRDQAGARG